MMEQALGRTIDDVVGEQPASTTLLPLIEGLNWPRLSGVIPVDVGVIIHSHRNCGTGCLARVVLMQGMSLGPDGETVSGAGAVLGQVGRGFIARDYDAGLLGRPTRQIWPVSLHRQGDEPVGGQPRSCTEVTIR